MLKLQKESGFLPLQHPAAFRRLCVETISVRRPAFRLFPAAFRRLCVETAHRAVIARLRVPAAFRRLCVETVAMVVPISPIPSSRLQAAVC